MNRTAGFDYRVIDPNHHTGHLRVVASARNHDRVHGVAIDITKQTNLEHELRQAQKLESVCRVAAGVAHELDTPFQFVNDSVRFLQTAVEDVMFAVDKHHGKLTFHSVMGKGTTCFVTIPIQQHMREAP